MFAVLNAAAEAVPDPGIGDPQLPPELAHKLHQLGDLVLWGLVAVFVAFVVRAGVGLWWSYRTGRDLHQAHLRWRWTLAGSAVAVLGLGAARLLLP